ncbi:MAG: hypothetical protein Q9161_003926 [Pseudevernia consocians]
MAPVSLSRGLWDPYEVLDVDPNNPVCTCVGVAKSTSLRCRWPFASRQFNAYQRATAVEILESMSKRHPSDITTAALYSLAQNTLCMEFHQWQADAKSRKWKVKIEAYLQYEPNDTKPLQNGFAKDWGASEHEIHKTRETLERVTAELKASQTLCSKLTEKRDKLDRQREDDQVANSREVARLTQQLTDFRTKRKTEVEHLKRQLDERNAKFEKELKGLRESKTRLETAIILETGSLKKEVRDRDRMLEERARASEGEADSLRQQLAASSGEVAVLKEAKASSDEKAQVSEKEADSLRQQLAASSRDVEVLKEEKALSDEKTQMSEKEADSLRQQLAASSREVEVLKEAKASSDEKVKVSERKAENVRQELQESNARREALDAKSSRDLKHVGQKLEALNQRHTESRNENAAQISRLQERDRKIERLEEQMDALTQGLAKRDRHVEDLVRQMDVVNVELAEREVGGSGTGDDWRKLADIFPGYIIVSPATECEKGALCSDFEAAAKGIREKDLEDHEDRIHSLCTERCLTFKAQSSTLNVQSAA